MNKKYFKRFSKTSLLILISSLIVFTVIAVLVATNNISWLDNGIYSVLSKIICDPVTSIFKVITLFCETEVVLIILALLLIFLKKKKIATYIVINSGLCVLLNQIVKRIFVRPRPSGVALITQGGYSFPSGHSMMALAFYGYIIYLINKSNMAKKKKIVFTCLLSTIIILVGISRIYLGVHYASDVIGAFSLGLVHLVLFINYVYKKKES